jgi:hypothetical protein
MATTNIDCEVCGGPGATEVTPPSGGTAEMCGPCIRYDRRQAEIDALAHLLDDMEDDEAEALMARIA